MIDPNQTTPSEPNEVACAKCCGNGEVVTNWEEYLHPPIGADGDHATADCPDCGGSGKTVAPIARSDQSIRALYVTPRVTPATVSDGAVRETALEEAALIADARMQEHNAKAENPGSIAAAVTLMAYAAEAEQIAYAIRAKIAATEEGARTDTERLNAVFEQEWDVVRTRLINGQPVWKVYDREGHVIVGGRESFRAAIDAAMDRDAA